MAKKNPLVIELGERLIRICSPAQSKEGKVEKLGLAGAYSFPMPANAMEDGIPIKPAELGEFVKEKLRKENIKAKEVIFVLNSVKIISRETTLPPVDSAKKLKALVDISVPDVFPTDLSGYSLGHTVIGKTQTDGKEQAKLRVVIAAVPSAIIDAYTELAEAAGLKIQAFDYAGNSQYQLFKRINAQAVTLYAYIDHNSSLMTFMRGEELLLQRGVSVGGASLVEDYLTRLGRVDDEDEYFAAVEELSQSDYVIPPMTAEEAGASFTRLAINIERSLRYFNSKYGDSAVTQVVLTGPLARLYQLREIVGNELALDDVILMTEQHEAIAALAGIKKTPQFVTALGASIEPVGFLQSKEKEKEERIKLKSRYSVMSGLSFSIICALVAAAALSWKWLELTNAKLDKSQLEARIASMEYAEVIYFDYLTYKGGADATNALIATVSSNNDHLREFFEELEEKMPREITVLSVSCTKQGISMNITVPTKTDVARVMVALREFESLGRMQMPSVSENQSDASGYVSFSIYYGYRDVLPEPTPPPQAESSIEDDLELYQQQGGAAKK